MVRPFILGGCITSLTIFSRSPICGFYLAIILFGERINPLLSFRKIVQWPDLLFLRLLLLVLVDQGIE